MPAGIQTDFENALAWDGDNTVFDNPALRSLNGYLLVNWYSSGASTCCGNVDGADRSVVSNVCLVNIESGGLGATAFGGTTMADQNVPLNGFTQAFVPTPGSATETRLINCGARNAGARRMWATDVLHYSDAMYTQGLTQKPIAGSGGSQRQGPRANP
jgi:hypothetical protein